MRTILAVMADGAGYREWAGGRQVKPAFPKRTRGEFSPREHLESFEQSPQVVLYRLRRDTEGVGDLVVRPTLHNQAHHVELPLGERHAPTGTDPKIESTLGNPADRRDQFARRRGLPRAGTGSSARATKLPHAPSYPRTGCGSPPTAIGGTSKPSKQSSRGTWTCPADQAVRHRADVGISLVSGSTTVQVRTSPYPELAPMLVRDVLRFRVRTPKSRRINLVATACGVRRRSGSPARLRLRQLQVLLECFTRSRPGSPRSSSH